MAFSSVGKKKIAAHVFLLLINILVLALSSRINQFQEFFFVADLFPFALSIVTLVLLCTMLAFDLTSSNSYIGRAQIEIGIFAVMSILWLAFNAFSTSRWRDVPFQCGAIPQEYSDIRTWCKDLQALKAFVWVEWLTFSLITAIIARYTILQNARGHKHIFKMPLSRFNPTEESGFGFNPQHWSTEKY
ncbi:hypothetical protein E1B28_005961 [Marasmius oreades]|uniref:MARVEL domain-containing protein n=1 Tax=Marasmius oreades TaxID=181124 RepID=A0A9P7S4Y0_9AGAR|nr:uncharacterized protein E1B28_005961 [Marasmius oreades]KAG7095182.1 hypothetical protein E1B28_005961 [Marasmius oreades]